MGKNRKYENVYQITLTGKTTNGFTPKVQHDMIKAFLYAMVSNTSGNGSYKVLKTEGDFNADLEIVEDK